MDAGPGVDADDVDTDPEPDESFGDPDPPPTPEPPQDAPYAESLFGDPGYDDFDAIPPPTEENPSGVLEDVSQTYSSPYTVPDPPPIPGILDRFTLPPAQRIDFVSREKPRDKPGYLDDTPAGSRQREVVEIGYKAASRYRFDGDAGRGWPPIGLWVVGGGLLCLLVVGVGLMAMMVGGGGSDPAARAPTPGSVEVRSSLNQKPGAIGTEASDADKPLALPPLVEPERRPDRGTADAPEPASPSPRTPGPPPRQRQTASAPASVAEGTLKIRSNRRVLVYVNDQAIGFTPQDHKVEPGTFTVSAMIAGQPDTKQTRDASVGEAGITVGVDFTF